MKYGFIYIWFDIKHKKYYVGRHWGRVDDGYICSSTNMRNNYKNRPWDFKRKIVSEVYTSTGDLAIEEQRWLNMIKKEELGVRYYNKTLRSDSPSNLGNKHSDETKRKISESSKGRQFSNYAKRRQREVMLGRVQSKDEKHKRSASRTGIRFKWKNKGSTKGMITVIDEGGNTSRINTNEFNTALQGMYVTVNSNEGKRRKGLKR